MKTKKVLLAGLVFIIMTACSSNPGDWEDGGLIINFGQKYTSGLVYKIDIDGPTKKSYERKSGDDNIEEKVRVGVYTISVIAYSDFVGGTIISEGSEEGVEVRGGAYKDITITLPSFVKAFTFPTTPESIGIVDEGAKTISVSVPFGTDVTQLTPKVVYTGKSYSPTGQQDFTSPVDYTVTALDDFTITYKVTVTVRELPQWAQSLMASGNSQFTAVAVDKDGNVYAAGEQADNAVLVKYDSNGTAQWIRSEAGTGSSQFNAVAVDKGGNVYAAGSQVGDGLFNYGNGKTVAGAYSSNFNVVLVKYNSDGDAQWAQSTKVASNQSYFNAVAVDSSYNVYAAGYMNGQAGTLHFGNGVSIIQTTYTTSSVVLVKYHE